MSAEVAKQFRKIAKLIEEALDQQDGGLVSTEHFSRVLWVCETQAELAELGLFEGVPE